jgi:plasmid stabilization system protein ParE
MMRLIYSDRALADIEGILHNIGKNNPAAAVRFGEGIVDTCRTLETNPELGAKGEELSPGVGLFTFRGYGIYYTFRVSKLNRPEPPARSKLPDAVQF